RHFEYFNKKMIDYRTRPTLMTPVWEIGGTLLGAITAKLGEKYVHACTESVEQVIVDHYKNQMKYLKKNGTNDDLLKKIKQFCDEEDGHRLDAKDHIDEDDFRLKLFKRFTSQLTSLAIRISKKV
ncbi:MAG: demethoxyubiquinone hydroxylase family protein, partial [Rickettsiales bacterium]|nr:demethoxyubiquinone hydroxylase family protein [Rickettsiales bacterium]